MGGSSTTNTNSSSQSVNEIPQWVQNAGQQNYALAQDVASQPLQQYQGQMVADPGAQMQQAWNLAANSGNVGVGAQSAGQAALMSGANYTPQQVSAPTQSQLAGYMNPYTQSVINATLPIMQQNLGLSQDQQQNAANSANAFGGSRQAIQQGVTQAQGAMGMGQMAANLNQANFTQGMGAAQQANLANQAAGLQGNAQQIAAGQGLGTLGGQQVQNNLAQYGMLTSAGALEQQQQQNDINAQIAQLAQAQGYPAQQLGILESALGMTPYNTGTSGSSASTQQTSQTNPAAIATGAMGMLGNLFSGGLGGSLGMAAGGGVAARGLTKVPGRRLSKKYEIDSEPYMLAPGEAVLNRHAAERLGRGKIAKLNSLQPASALPPSSPGVAKAIGALGPSLSPERVSAGALPPTRSLLSMVGGRRPKIPGALAYA